MKNFKDKRVYITGGSSGIGLAAARLFSSLGSSVVIFARNRRRLRNAISDIEKQGISESQRFACFSMDAADYNQVQKTIKKAVKETGAPDILINCAGRAIPDYFENIPFPRLDETMKVNFYSVWNTVSSVVPFMKKKGGYIVNTSSIAGFIGVFGYTDYCASKFAVIGFSEALRSECGKFGITVSVLCPPDTDTPGFIAENLTKPEETRIISANVKIMRPDEVARALVDGIRKERFMIIPGFNGRMTFLAKRLFPSLVDWSMERDIRRVHKG
jgi:3-dehydrosphinganine reductase